MQKQQPAHNARYKKRVARIKDYLDVNDLITQADAARLRGTTAPAISSLIKRKRLDTFVVAGIPMVFRSQVLAVKDMRKETKAA